MNAKVTKTFNGYVVDSGKMQETPIPQKRDYGREQNLILYFVLAILIVSVLYWAGGDAFLP